MDNNKPIYFTNHALDRLAEVNLTAAQAKLFLLAATKEKKSKKLQEYKIQKYGRDDVTFYGCGLHLFTVKFVEGKSGEEIALVITYSFRGFNKNYYGGKRR